MREVFLSHAGQDHVSARRLREVLVAHDVPVWFSPHHIRAAQQWDDVIGDALARCGWFKAKTAKNPNPASLGFITASIRTDGDSLLRCRDFIK
jgi:hypothetical protein